MRTFRKESIMKKSHFEEAKNYIEITLKKELISEMVGKEIVTGEQINKIVAMWNSIENSELDEAQKTELANALYNVIEGLEISEGSKKAIIKGCAGKKVFKDHEDAER